MSIKNFRSLAGLSILISILAGCMAGEKPQNNSHNDLDDDNDTVTNNFDRCPNTPSNFDVDSQGCALDSDNDDVPDTLDQCPDTLPSVAVTEAGCEHDADEDSIPDRIDNCPNTSPSAAIDVNGCTPLQIPPQSIFFIGNSFTYYGPVPDLVEQMARYMGFTDVQVDYRAIGGASLNLHRNDNDAEGAPNRLLEAWDAVVLQDQSTRPTNSGDPAGFYDDATWFYDTIRDINNDSRVYLYETWAWREDSRLFPDRFATPADMQSEIHYHYNEAANTYIPQNSKHTVNTPITVVPAGTAWSLDLQNGEDDGRLHDPDSHHAGPLGQYLNALVFYSTLFDRSGQGMIPLGGISEAQAAHLQDIADTVTQRQGHGVWVKPPTALEAGASFLIDIGPEAAEGWYSLKQFETATSLQSTRGNDSSIHVTVWGFNGEQTGGASMTDFGWPALVSRDSLWVGSHDSHADALTKEGLIVFRGLPQGNYTLEIFGSRDGDSSGKRRITRYSIGDVFVDLDAADNQSQTARLNATPDSKGEILLRVSVSPNSISQFGYINAIKLTTQ